MPKLYKVSVKPVQDRSNRRLLKLLMRFMGPDSLEEARNIMKNGGIVMEGLNQEASNRAREVLREAGAEASVIALENEDTITSEKYLNDALDKFDKYNSLQKFLNELDRRKSEMQLSESEVDKIDHWISWAHEYSDKLDPINKAIQDIIYKELE